MLAVGAGNLVGVKMLLAQGASVSTRDNDGHFLLWHAAQIGNDTIRAKITALLTQAGAKE
jgi:hypothetical protein